ncbi:hypothetical protein [Candidatus Palauibacter sp.]|uniref:hypothetical protein n=1 Tax=Candidatus Palauibacter sp. TaxID=3101350 RepID=UPI003B01F470
MPLDGRPGLSAGLELRQEQKAHPRLYQAMDLLHMPLLDLQARLRQELVGNPFLELVEPGDEDVEPGTRTSNPGTRWIGKRCSSTTSIPGGGGRNTRSARASRRR